VRSCAFFEPIYGGLKQNLGVEALHSKPSKSQILYIYNRGVNCNCQGENLR